MAGLLDAVPLLRAAFIRKFLSRRNYFRNMSAQGLPINLLAQFVPRPPAEFERPRRAHKLVEITPMSAFVEKFEKECPPPPEPFESPVERKNRVKLEQKVFHEQEVELLKLQYKPNDVGSATADPYRTLFVGRLAYDTTERTLKRVFDEWGRIKEVKLVKDKEGKSRGYAFIEYEDERDLKDAYKHADGIKIDGRNVLVDVERGRTVPEWLPRRLGGGKGPERVGFDPKQVGIKRSRQPPKEYPESKRYRDHNHRDNTRRDNTRYNDRREDTRHREDTRSHYRPNTRY